ncbi:MULTISPECIES: AraC family transcriptional regulator [Agrobacterium]|uniref:AraC family transcriptional regulator n=1 Tax=Agrobacterium TaxID=357 RepID=UPI0005592134|nr:MULTISPECIES: helix-turn-helix transcriptional regulator [Agrobacterium]CUX05934.1 DNA-binding domain-containing protein, AraC-type [Agrobacterium fabacearum S56]MDP9759676.1 AraC-like DNA-binding protein [Agrobacterium tumefaciens]MDQ1223483.1 AraC-like DNA-binding protein [Agrobacterium sp. SORGH_AS_0745]NSY10010.1 helix-turn-helix transcriptional regulator [Agrobacterium tumefaciens]NSY51849.1 helix-turn-helix transcriptional regulator [Agrobacterium tumefaciens]
MKQPQRAADLQNVPRPVAAMARTYEQSVDFGWHSHRRGQLLQIIDGFMTARTPDTSFIIPCGYGLLITPEIPHAVHSHGRVSMQSVYIEPDPGVAMPWEPTRVISTSTLLSATVGAFLNEPTLYDENGRGGHLAALMLEEIANAQEGPFALPMPSDKRLQRLCRDLSETPSLDLDIDRWADNLGMSRRTMTRKFRIQTGMSFAEWRRRLRMAHVMRRQAEGARLEEAAADVGYRSLSSLRKAMREVAG